MDANKIISSVEAATAQQALLVGGLDDYTSVDFSSAAANSDGNPPADHDSNSTLSQASLQAYKRALTRDAQAIVQIANSLDDADGAVASSHFFSVD